MEVIGVPRVPSLMNSRQMNPGFGHLRGAFLKCRYPALLRPNQGIHRTLASLLWSL